MSLVIKKDCASDESHPLQSSIPATQLRPATPFGDHVHALDGIRGLAVLLVMFYHLGSNAQAHGWTGPLTLPSAIGWCGVDLFFVLSGFLITGILFDTKHSVQYYKNFYARRMLRIAPLYYGAMLFVGLCALAWPSALWGSGSPLWATFYLTNFQMIIEGESAPGILTHYWSLAVEEHFYLVWPLLVSLTSRTRMMQIAGTLAVAALGLRIFLLTQGVDKVLLYFITPTRIDGLAIGALISLAMRGPQGLKTIIPKAWTALLISAPLLLMIIILRGPDRLDPLMQTCGYSLLAVTFGSLIIIGVTWPPLRAFLNLGLLRWFGKYSYGLYIWHSIFAVIIFNSRLNIVFNFREKSHLIVAILVTFALSIIVAWMSYHLWEKRFLALKRYFQDPAPTEKTLSSNLQPNIMANV